MYCIVQICNKLLSFVKLLLCYIASIHSNNLITQDAAIVLDCISHIVYIPMVKPPPPHYNPLLTSLWPIAFCILSFFFLVMLLQG